MSDSPASPTSTSDPLSEASEPQTSAMPPLQFRSAVRNVRLYGANDPTTELGGLFVTNGITNANFYSMVEIIIIFESEFSLCDEGGTVIEKDDHPLQPGKYYISATGERTHNHIFMIKSLSYKQVSTSSLMRDGWSVQLPLLPEPVSNLSVKLSVRETVNALYREKWCLIILLVKSTIRVLRPHISFRWPMKVTGNSTATAAILRFRQRMEKPSTLYRMGSCLKLVCTSYLMAMTSRSTLM